MSGKPEGNTVARDKSRARCGHCGVEDPRHAWKLHAREPRDPVAIRSQKGAERWEKAMSYKTHAHGKGESHSGIVLTERSNEGRAKGWDNNKGQRPPSRFNWDTRGSCPSTRRRYGKFIVSQAPPTGDLALALP